MSELVEPVPALHDALLLLPAPARNVTAALLPVLPRGAEGLQARQRRQQGGYTYLLEKSWSHGEDPAL